MELFSFDPKALFATLLLFIGGCMPFGSSKPVETGPVTSFSVPVDSGFVVEVRKDQSVWYSISYGGRDTSREVDTPLRENLGKAIAAYKKERAGKKTTYHIIGHPDSQFSSFEKIILAMHDNDEYKYDVVTPQESFPDNNDDEASGSLNLPEPKPESNHGPQYDNSETKLTLLLLNTGLIYGYEGKNIESGRTYDYKNVRDIIISGSRKYGNKFVIQIKPGKDASYKNTVDILDEMTINKIRKFELTPMNAKEKAYLENMNAKS